MARNLAQWLTGALAIWCLGLIGDARGCSSFVAKSLTALPNKKQEIYSPNFPKNYPNDDDRCWKIKTGVPGYVVNLATAEFQVEIMLGVPCGNADYLEIRDGYYETSPLLRKMCGIEHVNITSSGDSMYLRFKSDESVGLQGFSLVYQAIPGDVIVDPPDTHRDGCTEINKLTAFATITSDLESPNFPNSYPASIDRCWLIEALDSEMVIHVIIVQSLMEETYSCESGDYVEARDGSELSDKRLAIFCGDTYPERFMSSGPYLLLRFHTDQTANDFSGFHLRFTMVEPNTGNGKSKLTLDQSMQVLVGVGVVVIALAVIFAVIGFYKKSSHSQVHQANQARSQTRQNQAPTAETTVQLAFESILNQPMNHMRVTQANLRAPAPYQGPQRPPSHLGFVAPTQPGYSPWMVPSSNNKRGRNRNRHQRHGDQSLTIPATIQQYHETMYPPGTPAPEAEAPPYEDIMKALDESDWGIPFSSQNDDIPTILTEDPQTEKTKQREEDETNIEPQNEKDSAFPPNLPVESECSETHNEHNDSSAAIPGSVND